MYSMHLELKTRNRSSDIHGFEKFMCLNLAYYLVAKKVV